MRKILIMPLLAVVILISCTQVAKEETEANQSDMMFAELRQLTELYCDSMRNAKDSIEVIGLVERFEAANLRINEKYPPMTELTEGQNDTLSYLTMQFTHLRSQKLQPAAPTDSIPAEDTVEE